MRGGPYANEDDVAAIDEVEEHVECRVVGPALGALSALERGPLPLVRGAPAQRILPRCGHTATRENFYGAARRDMTRQDTTRASTENGAVRLQVMKGPPPKCCLYQSAQTASPAACPSRLAHAGLTR